MGHKLYESWVGHSHKFCNIAPACLIGRTDCWMKVLCLDWFPSPTARSLAAYRRWQIWAPYLSLLGHFARVMLMDSKVFFFYCTRFLHQPPKAPSLSHLSQYSLPPFFSFLISRLFPPVSILTCPQSTVRICSVYVSHWAMGSEYFFFDIFKCYEFNITGFFFKFNVSV